jgi:hypothetical protein
MGEDIGGISLLYGGKEHDEPVFLSHFPDDNAHLAISYRNVMLTGNAFFSMNISHRITQHKQT